VSVANLKLHGPWERRNVEGFDRVVDRDGDVVCTFRRGALTQESAVLLVPEVVALLEAVAAGESVEVQAATILREIRREL
jgi:hypothetical protein